MLERDDGLYQTGREMERDDGLYSEYREATQTRGVQPKFVLRESLWQHSSLFDDDDVYYYILLETKARRGDGEYGRLYEGAEGRNSRGAHGHSLH